jgi:hypothetical protein
MDDERNGLNLEEGTMQRRAFACDLPRIQQRIAIDAGKLPDPQMDDFYFAQPARGGFVRDLIDHAEDY